MRVAKPSKQTGNEYFKLQIDDARFLVRFDFDFVSEITRRGPLCVIPSYLATTSVCARNLITFPVFPRVQAILRANQPFNTERYKSKLSLLQLTDRA